MSVHAATATAGLGSTPARAGVSRLGPLDPEPAGGELAWAALALEGEAAGDVHFARDGAFELPAGTVVLLDGVAADAEAAPPRVGRDALVGAAVAGVTGARLLVRSGARDVLRLGPPPGARWGIVGLRSVAVLAGKLTLVDGEDARDVRAGEVAFVADPVETLHVVAGNDAAVAIAFGRPGVVVRLG